MYKTQTQLERLKDTKIICENCIYSISCSKLEPCTDYSPAVNSNFEAVASYKRTLTPLIIETYALKDY